MFLSLRIIWERGEAFTTAPPVRRADTRNVSTARAQLPVARAFASIVRQPEGAAMTDEERLLLDEALGRANAALALARALMQMLGELGIIPPSHLLDMQDVSALALEEVMGDRRATPDLDVQLRETRSTTAMLDDLPLFQAARAARRS